MKVIIGLGNPEEQYARTRHNVGFRVIDSLADKLGITLTHSPKLFSAVGKDASLILVKPQTYMNDSGRAVQAMMSFYKLSPGEITMVHDDLDIPLGIWKSQIGRGPKIHNGLLSIYQALDTKEFAHVRIGVDNRAGDKAMPGKNYVLQPFSAQEEAVIQPVIEEVTKSLLP
jgi:PTH1 family peptidyl-tRNA hydrolase